MAAAGVLVGGTAVVAAGTPQAARMALPQIAAATCRRVKVRVDAMIRLLDVAGRDGMSTGCRLLYSGAHIAGLEAHRLATAGHAVERERRT
jgi:hypothetical protein